RGYRPSARAVLARGLRAFQGRVAEAPRLAGTPGGPAARRPPARRGRSGRRRRGRRARAVLAGRRTALPQRRAFAEGRMILAVDCGNSRLKWGLHGGGGWTRAGSLPLSGLARLKKAWKRMPQADRIVVANVAGAHARRLLERVLPRGKVLWVKSRRRQC